MKGEGRVQPLRANTYNYCSALQRERAVSLLLSDLFKRRERDHFLLTQEKEKKLKSFNALSRSYCLQAIFMSLCLLVYSEAAITWGDLSRQSSFQWSVWPKEIPWDWVSEMANKILISDSNPQRFLVKWSGVRPGHHRGNLKCSPIRITVWDIKPSKSLSGKLYGGGSYEIIKDNKI